MELLIGGFVLFVILGYLGSKDTHKPDQRQQSSGWHADARHFNSARPQHNGKAKSYKPNIPHSSKYL